MYHYKEFACNELYSSDPFETLICVLYFDEVLWKYCKTMFMVYIVLPESLNLPTCSTTDDPILSLRTRTKQITIHEAFTKIAS